MRFNNTYSPNPGPGSYNSSTGIGKMSTVERAKGGKWSIDRKKDMVLRNSVGKLSNQSF